MPQMHVPEEHRVRQKISFTGCTSDTRPCTHTHGSLKLKTPTVWQGQPHALHHCITAAAPTSVKPSSLVPSSLVHRQIFVVDEGQFCHKKKKRGHALGHLRALLFSSSIRQMRWPCWRPHARPCFQRCQRRALRSPPPLSPPLAAAQCTAAGPALPKEIALHHKPHLAVLFHVYSGPQRSWVCAAPRLGVVCAALQQARPAQPAEVSQARHMHRAPLMHVRADRVKQTPDFRARQCGPQWSCVNVFFCVGGHLK